MIIFKKKPKIEVFVRHCFYSRASIYKERYPRFSHEKCHHNLMQTADFDKANFTFFLDTYYSDEQDHFIQKQTKFPIVEIQAGCEAKSFLEMLFYASEQSFSDDTIIYFLEDDYLHREGWAEILLEGLSLPDVDYVTLYDHRDKYFHPDHKDLKSCILYTKTCHWRTIPSTTNTYAMRFKTLKKHLEMHREFSFGRKISADHDKFVKLAECGATLISALPGWSTHVHPNYASPCHEWEKYLKK